MEIQRIPQDVFLGRYFTVRGGEHVALIGPNGRGKTTLAMKLMLPALNQNPDTRGLVLAMKPHRRKGRQDGAPRTGDRTLARIARADGARVIRDWPPPNPWRPPPYWVLWPRHTFDPSLDDPAHHQVFRRAILDCYKRGNWWIFADEVYSLTHELALGDELVTLWTKGRSMDTAIIGATQKPTHVPTWMYSQSRHLFLWYDGDHRARRRYAEISGFDPRVIATIVGQLRGHDCLYVHPEDHTLCIVTATESTDRSSGG